MKPGIALGDEVAAFLAGRLADHLVESGCGVPAWVVLNRLAHGTREELVNLVRTGEADWRCHPALGGAQWLTAERSLAARLIGNDGGAADELRRLQGDVLVPLELDLIDRSRDEVLTAVDVFDAASQALDVHLLGP